MEMAPEIKSHPLHQSCPLSLVLDSSGKDFVCNGCKLPGSRRYFYCCDSCDFNLHGECATCPETLSFWGHRQHDLVLERSCADMGKVLLEVRSNMHAALVSTTPKGGVLPVGCEMCMAEIKGMHYYCRSCGFFVHTVCAMLPMVVRSPAHEHDLALFCSFPTMCTACQMPAVWAYRCMPCLAFYHLNCLPENTDMFPKPYSDLPPNPFFVTPPVIGVPGGGAMFDEANPFGLVHTYRHRGL